MRLKTDKQFAHGHTECLWTVPIHLSHSVYVLALAHPGGSSPKRLGGSDLQPHASRTPSEKHPAHRTAANSQGWGAPGPALPQNPKGELRM